MEGMTWNRYVDWHTGWKDAGHHDGVTRGWFEHPSDAECTPQHYDAYGSWQTGHGGANGYDCGNHVQMTSNGGPGGHASLYGADHDVGEAAGMMRDLSLEGHHVGRIGLGTNGGHLAGRHQLMSNGHVAAGMAAGGLSTTGMSTGNSRMFGNGAAAAAQMYHTAVGPAGAAASGSEAEEDRAMMADMEESVRAVLPHDSSDDDEPDRPAEATAEEREEAEQVVRIAFKEAKERDRLREKVKKASPEDLQALLNARLGKR